MLETNDISLKQQIDVLKRNCIDRIANLVKLYGFDEGDEYVLDFVRMPRLAFYIDGGERICIDRISLVKESGDLFGENIEDFDDVMKYDLKKYFSVEDFSDIESHFDSFEKPVLVEKAKEKRYALIWVENDNMDERDTDVFADEDTAIEVMNDDYLSWVEKTRLIGGIEKKITDNKAYVKNGGKNYYKARIIKLTLPFAVVGGRDVFDDDCNVSEFLTYNDARKFVTDMGFEDYVIV